MPDDELYDILDRAAKQRAVDEPSLVLHHVKTRGRRHRARRRISVVVSSILVASLVAAVASFALVERSSSARRVDVTNPTQAGPGELLVLRAGGLKVVAATNGTVVRTVLGISAVSGAAGVTGPLTVNPAGTVAYLQQLDPNCDTGTLVAVRLATGTTTVVARSASLPVVSPDGASVAYVTSRTACGDPDIVDVLDLRTGRTRSWNLQPVAGARAVGPLQSLSWAADGRDLVIDQPRGGPSSGVEILDVALGVSAGNPQPVVATGASPAEQVIGLEDAAAEPNGDIVAVHPACADCARPEEQIVVDDPKTGAVSVVLRTSVQVDSLIVNPSSAGLCATGGAGGSFGLYAVRSGHLRLLDGDIEAAAWLPARASAPPDSAETANPATTVALSRIGDIAFTSTGRAYGIATTTKGQRIATSSDGGRSWTVTSPDLPIGAGGTGAAASQVGTGPGGEVYAYTPSGRVVVTSTDGGAHWTSVELPGPAREVTAAGSSLWALVGAARDAPRPPGGGSSSPAMARLYVSSDGGRSWVERATLPTGVGPYQVLVAPTASTAYALAPGEYNPSAGRYGGLAVTTDGGRRWTTVTQPCDLDATPRFGDDADLTAASASQLWMVCGQGGSPPDDLAVVARSADGGTHWTQLAGGGQLGSTADVSSAASTRGAGSAFPTVSRVTPAGTPDTAVFTDDSAWVVLASPGRVLRSVDGGLRWIVGAPARVEDQDPTQVFDVDGTIEVRTDAGIEPLEPG